MVRPRKVEHVDADADASSGRVQKRALAPGGIKPAADMLPVASRESRSVVQEFVGVFSLLSKVATRSTRTPCPDCRRDGAGKSSDAISSRKELVTLGLCSLR